MCVFKPKFYEYACVSMVFFYNTQIEKWSTCVLVGVRMFFPAIFSKGSYQFRPSPLIEPSLLSGFHKGNNSRENHTYSNQYARTPLFNLRIVKKYHQYTCVLIKFGFEYAHILLFFYLWEYILLYHYLHVIVVVFIL